MFISSRIGLTGGYILILKINKEGSAYFIRESISIKYISEISEKVSKKYHYFEIGVQQEEKITIKIKIKVEEVSKISDA